MRGDRCVAERLREQLAVPLDGVELRPDVVLEAVEPRRERLAGRGTAVAVHPPAREIGHPRALHESLSVDDRVVGPVAERVAERADLAPHAGAKQAAPPAAQRERDRMRNAGVHADERHVGLLDHPVELSVRQGAGGVGDRGEGVQDVPKRRQAHQQDSFHSGRKPPAPR